MSRNCFLDNWGESGWSTASPRLVMTWSRLSWEWVGRDALIFSLLLLHFKLSITKCFKKWMHVFYSVIFPGVQQGTWGPCAQVKVLADWPNWSWQLRYHKRNHRGFPQKKQGRGEPNQGRKVIPSVRWLRREQRSRRSGMFPIWDHGLATSSCC